MPGRWPSRLDEGQRRPTTGREEADPVGQAELLERTGAVAAADHREARAVGHRLGHDLVPWAKRRSSNAPSGPFHSTVPAPPTASAKAAAVSGPMSSPVQPSGRSPSMTLTLPRGPCPSEGGPKVPPGSRAHVSVGSRMCAPEASSARQSSRWVSSRSERPPAGPGRPGR